MRACGPAGRTCTSTPSCPTPNRTARRDSGFTIASGIGGTGVAGVLANGSGPAVLLRCELDALPLREATGAPYAATVTARDASGRGGARRSCLRP
jgi:hypothetical protein